jgi:hypothetical protein
MDTHQVDKHCEKDTHGKGSFTRQGKYRVVGSPSLRAIPYENKYELSGGVSGDDGEELSRVLQEAYADALKHPDYTITDFHAGIDDRLLYRGDYSKDSIEEYLEEHKNLIPPRQATKLRKLSGEKLIKQIHSLYLLSWTPSEIRKGKKKMVDGKTKLLKDAVLDETPIIIDILGKIGDRFVEVTETICLNGTAPTEEQKKDIYEGEVHYHSQNNCFKALKRFYSALQLHPEKENEPAMEKMVHFFNSQMGVFNKIRNELGVLEKMLTFNKPKWEDVNHNLELLKYSVPTEDKVFSTFLDMTENNAVLKIRQMMDYLADILNDHSRTFLRSIADL